jgi:hypothetical protein
MRGATVDRRNPPAVLSGRLVPIRSYSLGLACTLAFGCATAAQPPSSAPMPDAEPAADPSPTRPPAPDPLAEVTIPPRPDWTDPYADSNEGDHRFFDIDALMQRHGLSRAQAVELQNHYRDASRADQNAPPPELFAVALAKAQAGTFEDHRDEERLEQAPFIVVFDLDDTLYDQYYDPTVAQRCHDVAYTGDAGPKHIKLAPGWDEAIRRVRALGGAVVIYSANRDDTNLANLGHWELDGKPLTEHPDISAVLSNSHLVLQHKRVGRPVIEPSKDLRIVDPTLKRVIIVDDNPLRVFQFRNLRVVHKFDADAWCSDPAKPLRAAFEATLADVMEQIEDSVRYMKRTDVDFATAFLPYSALGGVAVQSLEAGGMSRRRAIEWVRTHPDAVPGDF